MLDSATIPRIDPNLAKLHPYESESDKADEEIIEGLTEITALLRSDLQAMQLTVA